MDSITSALKKYNANTRNKNTGDCVVRALSVAYKMDYDEVRNELNRIKQNKRYNTYKARPIFQHFISIMGFEKMQNPDEFGLPDDCTVGEFADTYTDGTYVLLVGKEAGGTDHLVCVSGGDVWDSWDCTKRIITHIYQIDKSSVEEQQLDLDKIFDEVMKHVHSCIKKSLVKMPYASVDEYDKATKDRYSLCRRLECIMDPEESGLQFHKWYRPNYTFTIKVNPTLSEEQNIQILKQKLWVRVREWLYTVRKECEDDMKAATVKPRTGFSGDKSLLIKLPEWAQPFIYYASDVGRKRDDMDRYMLDMEALEGDPRKNTEKVVSFRGDTLQELRQQLQYYKDDYSRFGWDY